MSLKHTVPLLLIALFTGIGQAQQHEHDGLMVGVYMQSLNHTNPYIHYDGQFYEPTNFSGFKDQTQSYYFPFEWAGYSTEGFGILHTAALDMIIQGIMHRDSDRKFHPTGSLPELQTYDKKTGSNDDLVYWEMDYLRMVYAGNIQVIENRFGILLGIQGGLGKFGIQDAPGVENSFEPSTWEDATPTESFNDGTDLYYGWNTGFTLFPGSMALYVPAQYDYHFFIGGVDESGEEYQRKGNRLLVESTFFPFDPGTSLGKMALKLTYRRNEVPYMREFVNWKDEKTTYTNQGFGIGVSYFVMGF